MDRLPNATILMATPLVIVIVATVVLLNIAYCCYIS